MIKTNSIKAWILAARPKTLSAAAVPVFIGMALAIKDTLGHIQWVPALLCLLFAWVMQIDSNLVNDYFDFKHGNDGEDRLGPKRACAEGWITLPAMKRGIAVTTLLGCAIGLPLILFGGWQMVIVGICCVIFCFLYTTQLSYMGMGDVLVLLFFGIVPVCCTYYLTLPEGQQTLTHEALVHAVCCGLVVDTLLVVNNYRDYDNDRKAGKRTLIVKIGKQRAEQLYFLLGFVPFIVMVADTICPSHTAKSTAGIAMLYLVYLVLHGMTYRKMKRIRVGKQLNGILGMTARNILLYGIICFVTITSAVWMKWIGLN